MEHRFTDDSLSLHTDLYQINMAETYWRDGIDQKKPSLSCFSESSLLTAVLLFLPFGKSDRIFARFQIY